MLWWKPQKLASALTRKCCVHDVPDSCMVVSRIWHLSQLPRHHDLQYKSLRNHCLQDLASSLNALEDEFARVVSAALEVLQPSPSLSPGTTHQPPGVWVRLVYCSRRLICGLQPRCSRITFVCFSIFTTHWNDFKRQLVELHLHICRTHLAGKLHTVQLYASPSGSFCTCLSHD